MSVIVLSLDQLFARAMLAACQKRALEVAIAQHFEDIPRSTQSQCSLLFIDEQFVGQIDNILPKLNESVSWVLLSHNHSSAEAAMFELGALDVVDLESKINAEKLLARALRFSSLQQTLIEKTEALNKANADLELNNDILRHDQQAGRLIQRRMLPETPWQCGDAIFEHLVIPSLYLSGDYVEYLKLNDDKVLLLIADVSGHGSSSAFITVLLKNQMARVKMIIDANHHQVEPHWVLENINNELLAMDIGKHVTAIAAVIDFNKDLLTWSVAGHLPGPLLTLQNDSGVNCQFLSGEGFPLGLFDSAEYQSQSIQVTKHFSLSLFSDGVLELGSKGEDITSREAYLLSLQNERIFSLQDWQRELGLRSVVEPSDDITLLIVSR